MLGRRPGLLLAVFGRAVEVVQRQAVTTALGCACVQVLQAF
jgi:hypothetical protein